MSLSEFMSFVDSSEVVPLVDSLNRSPKSNLGHGGFILTERWRRRFGRFLISWKKP
jgi:hypothetical protein